MEAFKCDRCGKYYDEYTDDNGYFKDEVYEIFPKSGGGPLDLCSECMKDFQIWISGGIKCSSNFDPNKRIDISEGLDPKTGEWGHNS